MGKGIDLELFREILKDDRVHFGIGAIKQIETSPDRSVMRVLISVFPEERELIGKMSWDAVGPSAGIFVEPMPNDLVLFAQVSGSEEHVYVIKRLTSKEDKIPLQVIGNHLVLRALAGKTAHLLSDTRIDLGRGSILLPPTEPLVLGNVMLAAMGALMDRLDAVIDAITTGPVAISSAPGQPAPTNPLLIAALAAIKATLAANRALYVTVPTTNIVSQVGFTER